MHIAKQLFMNRINYKNITTQIIDLIESSRNILTDIMGFSTSSFDVNAENRKSRINDDFYSWYSRTRNVLEQNGLKLNALKIENIYKDTTLSPKEDQYFRMLDEEVKMRSILNELIRTAEKIEGSDKEIEIIKIEDFNAFKEIIKSVNNSELMGVYDNSAFLEDDVENVFIRLFGETLTYKEKDSGAETRDLYTDRVFIDGIRHSTAILFKGRSVRGSLRISDCGKNGDQLLKLSKNTLTELFIVQHVNKIDPDVREALKDHILVHSSLSKIKMCFIDGLDTARILKGAGEDLDKLMRKKSLSGRKPKNDQPTSFIDSQNK